jgi:hypothetical protein
MKNGDIMVADSEKVDPIDLFHEGFGRENQTHRKSASTRAKRILFSKAVKLPQIERLDDIDVEFLNEQRSPEEEKAFSEYLIKRKSFRAKCKVALRKRRYFTKRVIKNVILV